MRRVVDSIASKSWVISAEVSWVNLVLEEFIRVPSWRRRAHTHTHIHCTGGRQQSARQAHPLHRHHRLMCHMRRRIHAIWGGGYMPYEEEDTCHMRRRIHAIWGVYSTRQAHPLHRHHRLMCEREKERGTECKRETSRVPDAQRPLFAVARSKGMFFWRLNFKTTQKIIAHRHCSPARR
jgi:hypothetical protein